ncbi:Ig-like domain-containing protein [Salinimonas marina]|uniref:Ig-like domain-containing protein n=1 Tax=Salinimonas marina TaxID=2785918 RepID=A0A7S9DWF3_9ALTE|nr:Ig-like domain-containing protein [Salinimonas marina]QPG04480.1 Ig-like domain-containing protein [Salinimonas marina]
MRELAKSLLFVTTLGLITACGGGGELEREGETSQTDTNTDADNDGQEATPVYTVAMSLQNTSGSPDKNLSQDNPLNASVTVADEQGNVRSDTLVTFSLSNEELASFSNDTGTARTDENGVASIGLSAGALAGDGLLTATTTEGEVGTITFTSAGTTQESVEPATLDLYTSKVQLASSGSDTVQLTALVKNSQSVLMQDVPVAFSAPSESGVEIEVTQAQTDPSGRALAKLSTENNAENRIVTVTARVGELTQDIEVEIVGTEVTINGTQSVILNDTVALTLRVQDSDGVAIANQTIEIAADKGELSANTVQTGSDGQVNVNYTGTQSGKDTISASSLNAGATFAITVQEDDFVFSQAPSSEVPLNTPQTLTVSWSKDDSAFAGGDVTFTASRGTITAADAQTNAGGEASFTIESDNAGIAAVTATGVDNDGEEVSARIEVEFVAVTPATLQADATPDILGPDGQKSTITAIVRDVNGNLVKNSVVTFNVDDTSTGSIAPSQATTDSNGVASTVFTSGAVTSEDAVVVTAQVAEDTAVADNVVLTVGNRPFDISIGTGNLLQAPDESTYLKEFAVFVTDSAGRPIEGEALTVSVTPVKFASDGEYRKGFWSWDDEKSLWVPQVTASCPNEDINSNGNLDAGEDNNGDELLTPGIVGSIRFIGDGVTDANGQATLQYRYPKEYAVFTDAEIAVFARSTASEASAYTRYTLSILASDISTEASPPPANPFGSNADCSSIR